MSTPSAEGQVRFLTDIQRLLTEGDFSATYKYALLLALADLAVEIGDDSGKSLRLSTTAIAEKFIEYYWRQSVPYATPTRTTASVLIQNAGKQAAVLTKLTQLHQSTHGNLADLRADDRAWRAAVLEVRSVVITMPLWKLQTVGRQPLEFLYERTTTSDHIELKPGVAFCLRTFHSLIIDLVQAAWTRRVRRLNPGILESSVDLDEFLFGSARTNLTVVQPILTDLQNNRCFYCDGALAPRTAQVDHFIPWSLYPVDLAHNFVLAHQSCNGSKSDLLAAETHLSLWAARNNEHGDALTREMVTHNVTCDLTVTNQIAQWAYSRTEQSGGQVWQGGDVLVPLSAQWRSILGSPPYTLGG